ncbi:MAG: bifunctional metallophosphatase/5'-nucleotidase [Chloroflexi bacterium]|nr:bifunctional metallophosphatase/5'-nucleotidase [Chloroflexota bacterium]
MTRLTILHTNDIHGRIEPLARIATLAKQIRREVESNGGLCALWDAGDAEDPSLFESSMTKGSAVMALMRAAGYELQALGNASAIRYGPQVIKGLAERFGQPLLAGNMCDRNTKELVEGLAPYSIQAFGDVKVGVIGLTAPMSIYDAFKLCHMTDPLVVLPDLIAQVRAHGAQMIVLLSHLGFDDDQKIAAQIPGLDLIIGGHSHSEINPPRVVNGTIIAQAGDYGRFVGRLDIEIDASGKIVHHRGELIPVGEEIPLASDFQAALAVEKENVQQLTLCVIGELRDPIDAAGDRQCAAGNLLADVLLDRVKGSEIAIVLAGHWRTGLAAGPLTIGALNAAMRSSANPARLELTGAQIAQFLQNALKPVNVERQLRPLRGVAVGMPHVAGMHVRYDPVSLELLDVQVGSQPLQADCKYVVAGTDLEFYDFVGYLVVPHDQIEYEVPTIMPEVLESYVAAHSPVSAPVGNRITTI